MLSRNIGLDLLYLSEDERAAQLDYLAKDLIFKIDHLRTKKNLVLEKIHNLMHEVKSNNLKLTIEQGKNNLALLAEYDAIEVDSALVKQKIYNLPMSIKSIIWQNVIAVNMSPELLEEISISVFPEFAKRPLLNDFTDSELLDIKKEIEGSSSPMLKKIKSRISSNLALTRLEASEVMSLNLPTNSKSKLNWAFNSNFFSSLIKYNFVSVSNADLKGMNDLHNFMRATSVEGLFDSEKSKYFSILPQDLVYFNIISYIAPSHFGGKKVRDYMMSATQEPGAKFVSANYAMLQHKPEELVQPSISFSTKLKYFSSEIIRFRPEQIFLLVLSVYFASLLGIFGAVNLLWIPALSICSLFLVSAISKNLFGVKDKLVNFFTAKINPLFGAGLSLLAASSIFCAVYFNMAMLLVIPALVGFLTIVRPLIGRILGLHKDSSEPLIAADQPLSLPRSIDLMMGSSFIELNSNDSYSREANDHSIDMSALAS